MCVVNCLKKLKSKFTLSSQDLDIQGIEVEETRGQKGGQIFEDTKRKSEIEGVCRVLKKNNEGLEDNIERTDEEISRRKVAKEVMRQPLAEVTD